MKTLLELGKGHLKSIMLIVFSTLGIWHYLVKKSSKANVLMYHRIVNGNSASGISYQAFEQHLKFLSKYYHVVGINEIILDKKNGTVNPQKVALTFDDGYFDFYTQAWPLLKKYNLPASIYITTDFIDGVMWMWPDKIRELLQRTSIKQVELSPLGRLYLDDQFVEKNWNTIADYCINLAIEEREAFIIELGNLLQINLPDPPSANYAGLTWLQLIEMKEEGLDIGSHTLTHPLLTTVSNEKLELELIKSKQIIEEKLNIEVIGICYPNGMHNDVSTKVIEVVKRCNYQYGLVAYSDNTKENDLFKIERLAASENLASFAFSLLSIK
jgi:peptidoglycan/xylan/chitin deacetylase (PgdA/CDA1 family)